MLDFVSFAFFAQNFVGYHTVVVMFHHFQSFNVFRCQNRAN